MHRAQDADPVHAPKTDEGLIRAIGPRALGATLVNLVVGGGIFVLPGAVAARLGAAALLAYLVCSAVVAIVFLCFAEVGSRITRSGGTYAYVEEAFGPFVGWIASVLYWFGWCALADAAIATALVDTLALAWPLLAETGARAAFLVAMLGGLAAVNVAGVQTGLRVVLFNTAAKLIPLLVLGAAGLFAIDRANLVPTGVPTLASVGSTSLLLFFAFGGAESALNASGEIEDPPRTVPRGLLLGLSGVLILYVWLQTVAQGVLGPALADNLEAPLAATAEAALGAWGAKLVLAGTALSIFGTLSGEMLGVPRVLFASARDGLLPHALTRVHPRFRTPHVAILTFAALVCALAVTGTFARLAVVASGSILLLYMGVCLAVLKLRRRDGPPPPGAFSVPGGAIVPLLACAFVIWLLSGLTLQEAAALAALAGAAALLFGVRWLRAR